MSGDEVVNGQVEVQLLRWTVRPSRSHIVVGSLEGERDAGPITAQALPRVVAVIGDLLTQQACVELGEGTGIGLGDELAELIVRFINTLDVEGGTDVLDTVDAWQSWLSAQGLAAGFGRENARDLEQARELRDDLRALASGERRQQGWQVGIQVALTDDGEVELGADTAVGLIAAAAAKVAIEKRLDRVKICPADNCRWAFYDSSRNHSRQWCSMEVCGNRAKARAHRERSTLA